MDCWRASRGPAERRIINRIGARIYAGELQRGPAVNKLKILQDTRGNGSVALPAEAEDTKSVGSIVTSFKSFREALGSFALKAFPAG